MTRISFKLHDSIYYYWRYRVYVLLYEELHTKIINHKNQIRLNRFDKINFYKKGIKSNGVNGWTQGYFFLNNYFKISFIFLNLYDIITCKKKLRKINI